MISGIGGVSTATVASYHNDPNGEIEGGSARIGSDPGTGGIGGPGEGRVGPAPVDAGLGPGRGGVGEIGSPDRGNADTFLTWY